MLRIFVTFVIFRIGFRTTIRNPARSPPRTSRETRTARTVDVVQARDKHRSDRPRNGEHPDGRRPERQRFLSRICSFRQNSAPKTGRLKQRLTHGSKTGLRHAPDWFGSKHHACANRARAAYRIPLLVWPESPASVTLTYGNPIRPSNAAPEIRAARSVQDQENPPVNRSPLPSMGG